MNLDSWFTDDITLAPFTGRDGNGKPTYGAQVGFKGRVERKQQRVINTEGQETPTNTVIATAQSIGPQDRVWFSAADTTDDNQARVPVAVSSARNKSRDLQLFEVFF